jgi:uncharacterized protein
MRELAELAAALRRAGVVVGTDQVEAATHALAAVAPGDARLALRSVLCSSHADLERFDALWSGHAAGRLDPMLEAAAPALPRVRIPRFAIEPGAGAPEADSQPQPSMWSDVELLLERDFGELSGAETELVAALIAALPPAAPVRRSRRRIPSHAERGRPHLQRTLRAALRNGGEPIERHWRVPGRTPRPLVLVLDVSGSMGPYARMLLIYAHATVSRRRRVEAFAFGTRLTRITHELSERDPAVALARARSAVVDWAGGTRTGESLASLTREHGARVGRGAVVVVLSDGWDRGDPAQVEREMARLARVSHSVVWLNPLKARPGYEPLARGMAAALPHVDHFLSGHSVASLVALGDLLREVRA